MSRPLVLAIEPDLRQAAIVKRVIKERVQAEVVVVDSRDAAIAAIRTAVPDVLLLSALLSPRDEDDLIAHLRTLEDAAHLQTHTIPQLASALGRDEDERGGGLLSAFRRKKTHSSAPAGCDPDLFADEVRVFLNQAAERKRHAAERGTVTPLPSLTRRPAEVRAPAAEESPAPAAGSSWASPFEWRPSNPSSFIPNPSIPDPSIANPAIPDPPSPSAAFANAVAPEPFVPEPFVPEPFVPEPFVPEPPVPEPAFVARKSEPIPAPPVHVPSPLSVWARTESPKPGATVEDREFAAMFARLGVPEGVAAMGYPEGVRIRRVRVRAARESHSSLQGAVLLGKRMLAELKGSDAAV